MADRATGEAVGTILALGTLVLFAGLLLPALDGLTDAAAAGQATDLEGQAQRLSAELQAVDRLVRRSDSTGRIARHVALPDRIGGERYTITVRHDGTGPGTIQLTTTSETASGRARFASATRVRNATLPGGELTIIRENGSAVVRLVPTGAN